MIGVVIPPEYYVPGNSIPDVDFDVGDSWAGVYRNDVFRILCWYLRIVQPGLMPISADKNETRKLFFWFFPSKDPNHTEDLV